MNRLTSLSRILAVFGAIAGFVLFLLGKKSAAVDQAEEKVEALKKAQAQATDAEEIMQENVSDAQDSINNRTYKPRKLHKPK